MKKIHFAREGSDKDPSWEDVVDGHQLTIEWSVSADHRGQHEIKHLWCSCGEWDARHSKITFNEHLHQKKAGN